MARPEQEFNTLTDEEQRLVAERLLKIEQSGWKPFWCRRSDCDGNPHVLRGPTGAEVFVRKERGPNGEAVGDYYEAGAGGARRVVLDKATLKTGDRLLGRVALEPGWEHNHARADQRLPPWSKPWTLFIMSGRGSGKTRTGVEFVTLSARKGLDGAIVGRRGTELENTHVRALIDNAHPEFVPEYFASKQILVWPNKAITYLFSAEKPENIRSVNLSYVWFDEAAFMDEVEVAWMNAELATRIETPGNPIHKLITSTPTSTEWVMKMEDDEDVIVRRVSTFANRANLSPDYLRILEKEYAGTRKGRAELEGEVIRDVEGAMWDDDMFVHKRVDIGLFPAFLETLDARILSVDPAGSKGKRSDATGIVAVGAKYLDRDGERLPWTKFAVLGDGTLKGTPTEWAARVFAMARFFRVHKIIAEKNFGADMVKQVLTDYAKLHPEETKNEDGEDFVIEVLHASQAKEVRAEGTVGKYEQGRVTHVTSSHQYGDLSKVETEQTTWVPKSRGGKHPSPNRVDALVWAVRDLDLPDVHEVSSATSKHIMSLLKRR